MLSLFPLDVLDEIWDLIQSVSEGFPAYFHTGQSTQAMKAAYMPTKLSDYKTNVLAHNLISNIHSYVLDN